MNPTVLGAIAKKELLEHSRRGGVIVIAALFLLLTVGVTFAYVSIVGEAAQGAGSEFDEIRRGVFNFLFGLMQTFVGLLIPIIAMVIAHGTIAGELETGSLPLLMAQPVSRLEVILGKFLGLWAVLASAEILGFGVAGFYIAASVPGFEWSMYAAFIGGAVLFAGAYLGLFVLFSALVRRRTAALVLAVASWVVFGGFYDFAVGGAIISQTFQNSPPSALGPVVPGWFIFAMFLSPPDLFAWFVKATLDVGSTSLINAMSAAGFRGYGPLEDPWALAAGMLGWIVVSVAAAWQVLERKDV